MSTPGHCVGSSPSLPPFVSSFAFISPKRPQTTEDRERENLRRARAMQAYRKCLGQQYLKPAFSPLRSVYPLYGIFLLDQTLFYHLSLSSVDYRNEILSDSTFLASFVWFSVLWFHYRQIFLPGFTVNAPVLFCSFCGLLFLLFVDFKGFSLLFLCVLGFC